MSGSNSTLPKEEMLEGKARAISATSKSVTNEGKNITSSPLFGKTSAKRQSMYQIAETMKSYLARCDHRRQSLPSDISTVLPSQSLKHLGSHLSSTAELASCPESPSKCSFASTHMTPRNSISSFVSSLDEFDDFLDENNLTEDTSKDHSHICLEIEKYLDSLQDVDFLTSISDENTELYQDESEESKLPKTLELDTQSVGKS